MKNVAMALYDRNETIITYSLISTYLMIENEKAFGKNQSRLSPFVKKPE
ncbi:hypothetical protein [Chryseobacterium sp. MEBOG07]|nr:hypothetical protein [Chryseobacterium sp. MEBOG07]UKB81156.1 hypothetical protein LF886_09270 [Chryseobacterium sp. MEBOG07]